MDVAAGGGAGLGGWLEEFGEWERHTYTTMHKQVASRKLLYSTGSSAQCAVMT